MCSHLDQITMRLWNERARLKHAKSDKERKMRAVWIAQIEKELKAEKKLLADKYGAADPCELSDDELLRELMK